MTRLANDRGETLTETLLSVMFLGVLGLGVLSATLAAVSASQLHGNQSGTAVDLRNWAEQVSADTTYVPCAAPADFPTPALSAGNSASIVSVQYWNGSRFVTTCPSPDLGAQRVTLQVSSGGGDAVSFSQRLDVVVRRP